MDADVGDLVVYSPFLEPCGDCAEKFPFHICNPGSILVVRDVVPFSTASIPYAYRFEGIHLKDPDMPDEEALWCPCQFRRVDDGKGVPEALSRIMNIKNKHLV